VQLDDLVVRLIEPPGALLGRKRCRDVLRPPASVRARIAVREADNRASVARDEKHEVVASCVLGQALLRPLVRQRPRTERRSMNLAQLRAE